MRKVTFVCFIFTLCFTHSFGVITWNDFMKNAKNKSYHITEKLKPIISTRYPFTSVSEQCTKSLIRYVDDLKNWETWAVSMFDVTGKPFSSFLRGTNLDFGSLDDCLEADVKKNEESDAFRGRFCILHMQSSLIAPINFHIDNGTSYFEKHGHPPNWISDTMKYDSLLRKFGLYFGICIPSTCSEEDIINIVTAYTKSAELKLSLSDCQIDEPRKWSLGSKLSLFFVLCLVALASLGTYLDSSDQESKNNNVTGKDSESLGRKMLTAFSYYKNWDEMKTLNEKTQPLHFLPGIQFWLCMWVTFASAFYYQTYWKERYYTNFHNILELFSPITLIYENITSAADYYFCISGFLLTYTLWKKLETNDGNINIKEVIIKKICRLAPSYAFFIMLLFIVPLTLKGPIWISTWSEELRKYYDYGWDNLFFIQNFLHFNNASYTNTWYIAVYLQIQVVSVLLLVFTYRHPTTGIICGLLINLGCYWHVFNTSLTNGYLLPSLKSTPDIGLIEDYLTKIYIKPYHHVASHTFGMILGWLIIKGYRIPNKYHFTIWILYICTSILSLCSIYYPTQNITLAAFHNTFYNSIQILLFTWILYTCTTGSAGFLRSFFSSDFYIPMDKLNYCVYMLHPLVIVFFDACLRERIYMSKVQLSVQGFAVIIGSFILATGGYILVQGPFNKIYELCFTDKFTVITENSDNLEQNEVKNETEKKEL